MDHGYVRTHSRGTHSLTGTTITISDDTEEAKKLMIPSVYRINQ